MHTLAPGWELEVGRGPGWLVVKVTEPPADASEPSPLADQIWSLLEEHLIYRVVLELGQIPLVDSRLLGQLILLQKRIREHGGMLRLCGLSPFNQEVVETHRLGGHLPCYNDLEEAVMGAAFPNRPR